MPLSQTYLDATNQIAIGNVVTQSRTQHHHRQEAHAEERQNRRRQAARDLALLIDNAYDAVGDVLPEGATISGISAHPQTPRERMQ